MRRVERGRSGSTWPPTRARRQAAYTTSRQLSRRGDTRIREPKAPRADSALRRRAAPVSHESDATRQAGLAWRLLPPGADTRHPNEEPANREPVNREPVNREPVNPEPVNREPVNREPVNPEPVNREPANPRTRFSS